METKAINSVKHLNQFPLRAAGIIMRMARMSMSTIAAPDVPGTVSRPTRWVSFRQKPHERSLRVPSLEGLGRRMEAMFDAWLGQTAVRRGGLLGVGKGVEEGKKVLGI